MKILVEVCGLVGVNGVHVQPPVDLESSTGHVDVYLLTTLSLMLRNV